MILSYREALLVKVLFICLGNICRSPTAEGVFAHKVARADLSGHISTDSCGTARYHIGKPPDTRACQAAARRGIDITGLRARQLCQDDFTRFDYLIAMDGDNVMDIKAVCPPGLHDRVSRFLDFAPKLATDDVPDPYYGGPHGFETVLDLSEKAAAGLLARICQEHGLDD